MAEQAVRLDDVETIRRTCVCANLQRAARVIGRRFDEAFRPLHLTNWQFTLLLALHRPQPPTINVVARELATDRTTITANLKPLERQGWVTVEPDGEDRRARRLSLTTSGIALLGEAHAVWTQAQDAVMADLAREDVDHLLATLRTLAAVRAEERGACDGGAPRPDADDRQRVDRADPEDAA